MSVNENGNGNGNSRLSSSPHPEHDEEREYQLCRMEMKRILDCIVGLVDAVLHIFVVTDPFLEIDP